MSYKLGKPVIDLSDDDSDSDQEQKQIGRNDKHYNTLNFNDHSSNEYQSQIKKLMYKNSDLVKKKGELELIVNQLNAELARVKGSLKESNQRVRELESSLCILEGQIEEIEVRNRKDREFRRKQQKEKENRDLNQEMMRRVESKEGLLLDKVKKIVDNLTEELSKQKMSTKVEGLIQSFIQEIASLDCKSKMTSQCESRISDKTINFQSGSSKWQSLSISVNDNKFSSKVQDCSVGDEYKLLSKSIDKLKNMERDIDVSGGSYLKRETELTVSRSPLVNRKEMLDRSDISMIDKSKSRRKRIFD